MGNLRAVSYTHLTGCCGVSKILSDLSTVISGFKAFFSEDEAIVYRKARPAAMAEAGMLFISVQTRNILYSLSLISYCSAYLFSRNRFHCRLIFPVSHQFLNARNADLQSGHNA